jgi:hypothetical protein
MATRRSLAIIALLILMITLASGCATDHDFNAQVNQITKPYRFDLAGWEFDAIAGKIGVTLSGGGKTDNATAEILTYFTNAAQIRDLENSLNAISAGNGTGDPGQIQDEIDKLRQKNEERSEATEKALQTLVSKTLAEQGIYNPADKYVKIKAGFPPVEIHLGDPPHLLIISPRDRIENIKEVKLLPEMSLDDMEKIESEVDKLGVSSIVEGLGGLSTYPSYVNDNFGLKFAIETAVHEWMHQYLSFTPLGIRYVLDQLGIRQDYDIATINETVADMVGREAGDIIYNKYFPQLSESEPAETTPPAFDFNKAMRETRQNVDGYLARGEIEQAEAYMEQQRQYLAANGYYIRKLNQAYFAFHGTYADSPTSISPIGAELKQLRDKSDSLKDFLDNVVGITSAEDLANELK